MQPEVLEQFDALYDYVQVMGINRVGRQGEPFEPRSLALIERLRHRYPDLAIQVDGGVSLKTARQLVRAGATKLVVGHAIVAADNPEEAYRALYTEANAR
jgi:ribulose-phosphate 3-epimerase